MTPTSRVCLYIDILIQSPSSALYHSRHWTRVSPQVNLCDVFTRITRLHPNLGQCFTLRTPPFRSYRHNPAVLPGSFTNLSRVAVKPPRARQWLATLIARFTRKDILPFDPEPQPYTPMFCLRT